MRTEDLAADLGLLQISDSFFPAGLYSMSGGLETLFVQKAVISSLQVEKLVRAQIRQQVGPCDCVAAASAHRLAGERDTGGIARLDSEVMAIKAPLEARQASARSGAQALRAACQISGDDFLAGYEAMVRGGSAEGSYPVSLGILCRALGVSAERASLSLLYGFTVSVVGAALRLGIIQHLEGQEIIGSLGPDIVEAAEQSSRTEAVEMWQFTPHLDIAQMDHERAETRMFAT